jgi:hypothetical protein
MVTIAELADRNDESPDGRDQLRDLVLESLRTQGFKLRGEDALLAPVNDKDSLRLLHQQAVAAQRDRARGALERFDERFTRRLIRGADLDPTKIRPELRVLPPGRHQEAMLWRWCSLHWAIPVSGGYGRRIRALVVDAGHDDAIMGLIGLGDPVYALGVRDAAIEWTMEQRQHRLTSVMDAFVLGAVPPYNDLLAGKLTALLLASDELRDTFAERYRHRQTVIADRDPRAELALVTTASALGRSSVYNRVRAENGALALRPVGYTQGTGDFHFSGDVYDLLARAARSAMATDAPTHRHESWGTGFRNRREVIQRGLRAVGLNHTRFRMHGVQREVFFAELASNSLQWLRGETDDLAWTSRPTVELADWWKRNWMAARARSTTAWQDFEPTAWRLYP